MSYFDEFDPTPNEEYLEAAMEEIEILKKQNKKLVEALGKTRKELAVALNFLHSMKWQYYDAEEPEFQCQYSLSETLFNLHKFNLSETPNSSKEEV